VLFSRSYQNDLDIDTLELRPNLLLSPPPHTTCAAMAWRS
jgi:hypothetical protein